MPMPRRRQDDFLPDASAQFGVGTAEPDIPYDQTAPEEVEPPMIDQQPVSSEMPDTTVPEQPAGLLAGLGAGIADDTGAMDSGDMSDVQLDQMANPEEDQAQALVDQLNDPSIPPNQKAQIQAQLSMAARRRMAGV